LGGLRRTMAGPAEGVYWKLPATIMACSVT
jgi:hypothetical protein